MLQLFALNRLPVWQSFMRIYRSLAGYRYFVTISLLDGGNQLGSEEALLTADMSDAATSALDKKRSWSQSVSMHYTWVTDIQHY